MVSRLGHRLRRGAWRHGRLPLPCTCQLFPIDRGGIGGQTMARERLELPSTVDSRPIGEVSSASGGTGGWSASAVSTLKRAELKRLASTRIAEAKVLLEAGYPSGAYYLAGYAVECGLKACIAKQFKLYEFPDKQVVNDSYTHSITKLVKTAGLDLTLDQEFRADRAFEVNWGVVKDWSENTRYELISAQKARDMYVAVDHRRHGVLRWIRR